MAVIIVSKSISSRLGAAMRFGRKAREMIEWSRRYCLLQTFYNRIWSSIPTPYQMQSSRCLSFKEDCALTS
jgi:hypothetical protein